MVRLEKFYKDEVVPKLMKRFGYANVMLFNPATGKGERVATKVLENGKRIRVFRSSGEAI